MGQALFDGIFAGEGEVAKTLLNLFGGTGTITNPGAETYNPLTGQSSRTPATQFEVDAAPPENYSIQEIDGSKVRRTDLKTSIPASDVTTEIVPEKSTLLLGGLTYFIISVFPVMSGDETAMYELQLRR